MPAPTHRAPQIARQTRSRHVACLLFVACALWRGAPVRGASGPTGADGWTSRAIGHVERGRFAEAMEAYDEALALDSGYMPARLGRADAQYRRGAYDEALTAYTRISEAAPAQAVAHYMRGLIHARRGDTDEAVAAQEATIAADPTYATAHYQLGSLRAGAGEWDAARASLEEATRLAPHMPEPYYQLSRVYRQFRDGERAEAAMRRFRVENERVEAMARLEETLAAGAADDRTGALVGLGLLHIERDEFDRAEARLRAALPAERAHAGLGRVALERERFADAVTRYTHAFELGFDEPQARYHAGFALMRLGDGVRAMTHLQAAIHAEPDMAEAHLLIATLYAARRDTPQATRHYAHAVELDPDDAIARHSLAYLYGREEIELPRAVALAREATRLAPTTALYHNTLSWLLLKSDDRDAAEIAALRAVELAPGNAVYRARLSAVREHIDKDGAP